ncbi:MAG: DUF2752 domain-containing protein [Bacteroidetes bacterium]|nr:DUF2752 domain-containing protein [Bacteroidota bacterium]
MVTMANFSNGWMLPCPVKAGLGIDCPGCGFQRAFFALLQGDFAESWHDYPPLIPFLVTLIVLLVALKTKFRFRMPALVASLTVTCIAIFVNYAFKMY